MLKMVKVVKYGFGVIREALKGNLYICVCGCDKAAELE